MGEVISSVPVLNRQNTKVRDHLWQTETCEEHGFDLQTRRTDLFQHTDDGVYLLYNLTVPIVLFSQGSSCVKTKPM